MTFTEPFDNIYKRLFCPYALFVNYRYDSMRAFLTAALHRSDNDSQSNNALERLLHFYPARLDVGDIGFRELLGIELAISPYLSHEQLKESVLYQMDELEEYVDPDLYREVRQLASSRIIWPKPDGQPQGPHPGSHKAGDQSGKPVLDQNSSKVDLKAPHSAKGNDKEREIEFLREWYQILAHRRRTIYSRVVVQARLKRRTMGLLLPVALACSIGIAYALGWWPTIGSIASTAILILSFFAGMAGAAVSVARRLYSVTLNDSSELNAMRLNFMTTSVLFSVVSGGIFAWLLLALIANLKLTIGTAELQFGLNPQTWSESLLKIVIPAFLAGFAEQLVPDMLDRMADGIRSQGQKK